MPSFILIHPTVWPHYTNVTDRQRGQTDRQTDKTTDRQHRANRFTNGRPKRGTAPTQFLAHVYCGKTAGMEVDLGPGHIVLDGDPVPQFLHSPQFSAHVYCGQTAVCIRIPLGMEVGLSLVDIVLDGDPDAPIIRGTAP